MSQHPSKPAAEILPRAIMLLHSLAPGCTRIALAGSLRRGEREVSDVELVAQSHGEALEALLADWLRIHQIERRRKTNGDFHAWGPRQKAFTWAGLPIDLFIVLPDRQWGPNLLIRTGPKEANDSLVTPVKWQNRHGRWGCLPRDLKFRDMALWRGSERLDTPEEFDVYKAIGFPYVPPPFRSYVVYQAIRRHEPMRAYPPEWTLGDDLFVEGERVVLAPPVATIEQPLEQSRLL